MDICHVCLVLSVGNKHLIKIKLMNLYYCLIHPSAPVQWAGQLRLKIKGIQEITYLIDTNFENQVK